MPININLVEKSRLLAYKANAIPSSTGLLPTSREPSLAFILEAPKPNERCLEIDEGSSSKSGSLPSTVEAQFMVARSSTGAAKGASAKSVSGRKPPFPTPDKHP